MTCALSREWVRANARTPASSLGNLLAHVYRLPQLTCEKCHSHHLVDQAGVKPHVIRVGL